MPERKDVPSNERRPDNVFRRLGMSKQGKHETKKRWVLVAVFEEESDAEEAWYATGNSCCEWSMLREVVTEMKEKGTDEVVSSSIAIFEGGEPVWEESVDNKESDETEHS
jgi:hypothetical protein